MKKHGLAIASAIALTMLMTGCGGGASADETTAAATEAAEEASEEAAATTEAEAEASTDGGVVRIGVTTALTGPSPLNGQRTQEGVTLAQEEINAAGGINGMQLEIVIEDDGSTTSGTLNSVNRLLSSDVCAVIGPHMSSNVLAVEETLEEAGMPFLAGGSSTSLYDLENPYLFRVRPSDSLACDIAVKYLIDELNVQNVGMIYDTDDWATSAKDIVEETLAEAGINFVSQGYNTGDTDMSGQLTQLMNAGIDSLIVWGHDAELTIIARQIKEVGLDVPIFGSAGFAMSTVLDLIDPSVSEGILTVSEFTPYDETPVVVDFVEKYNEAYGTDPDLYSAAYYDAVYLLKDAIERAGSTDTEAVRQALTETKDLAGVMSTMTYAESGDMIHEMSICEVRDGKAYVIQKVYEDGYEP